MRRSTQKPGLLAPAAVGETLGVSLSTVWRMIRSGQLPTIRVGNRRFVAASALRYSVRQRQAPKLAALTLDHPLFKLEGAGRSGGAGPGSNDKYAYLGEP